ncbi:polysaccharide deacetylase family protein [Halosimplex sp. TS25]|uniref:polysaccharide deacetylase family protein n=1 Tax=Halosimplex rarum TaxID=3396619 RepID=UPI0039E9A244
MNRRRFLRASGVVVAGGLAGCGGDATADTPPDSSGPNTGGTVTAEPNATTATTTRSGGTTTATDTATATPSREQLQTDDRSRERYGQPGSSLAPLDGPDEWQTVAGEASASDRGITDAGGVKLVGPGGENASIAKSISPTDLSDRDLSVGIRSTTPREIGFVVRLVDGYGNYAALSLRKLSYQPPDVGWFRTCPGVYATSDQVPDLANVQRVQLVALNASPDDVEVWVDDVRTHPKPDRGYVVLSWDDGRRAYAEEAAPLHRERDLPGVVTMPPTVDHVGQGPFMSRDQFHAISEAGDEVVAHGTTGRTFSTVSAERLDEMLARKKRWLLANDFDGSDFVVYPGNNFDATSLDVTDRYFQMGGMNQAGDVNTTGVNGFDPLVLPRTIGHDLEVAKTVVDRAAVHRNCGILNFHHFGTDNTMDPGEYERLLDYVVETDGVEAITFSDLWSMRTE